MNAPAQHLTVLLREAVEALAIKPAGVYVDATFGRGGHSRAILEKLGPNGRLLALDRDPRAIVAAAAIGDARLKVLHRPFAELGEAVREAGFGCVDGVLMDIGVSSPQLDEGERGFSFRFDAPLDMRMDTTQGETAAEWLARAASTLAPMRPPSKTGMDRVGPSDQVVADMRSPLVLRRRGVMKPDRLRRG